MQKSRGASSSRHLCTSGHRATEGGDDREPTKTAATGRRGMPGGGSDSLLINGRRTGESEMAGDEPGVRRQEQASWANPSAGTLYELRSSASKADPAVEQDGTSLTVWMQARAMEVASSLRAIMHISPDACRIRGGEALRCFYRVSFPCRVRRQPRATDQMR